MVREVGYNGMDVLQQWLTAPVYHRRDARLWAWLSAAIAAALVYSFLGLQQAFAHADVIHDDVRSHVFWMHRFLDPGLFPDDIITDYFQSVAPSGYTTLYQAAVAVGVHPLLFNKLLPLVLVLLATGYGFWLSMRLFPVPAAGFLATLLLNQTTWNTHDIPSGTPRAFIYPLFLAFLYYLVQRSLLPMLVTIVLQGLFYPQCLFLSSGMVIIRLIRRDNREGKGLFRLSPDRRDYVFCVAGLAIAFVMLLPYALKISDYGPVLTRAQGMALSTMQNDGRKNFFFDDPLKFWFCGERSGLLPYNWCKYEEPPQLWASIWLLAMVLWPKRFPLLAKTTQHIALLPQILFASLGMFFLSHAVLFRLHLPSRYTKHSLRMMVALAAGIALICLLDTVLRWAKRQWRSLPLVQYGLAWGATGCLAIYSFGYPFTMEEYPNPDYVSASPPELYDFFEQQPVDTLVASLSEDANNIPSLSKRSILTASEIANPYHYGYYQVIQARTQDLLRAQYTTRRREVLDFLDTYRPTLWLLDRNAFTPQYITENSWLREIEAIAPAAVETLENGDRPIIARSLRRCRVMATDRHIVLDTECIYEWVGRSGVAELRDE